MGKIEGVEKRSYLKKILGRRSWKVKQEPQAREFGTVMDQRYKFSLDLFERFAHI
jgi:hypothetical protein